MAKKSGKSLKQRIDELINQLGEHVPPISASPTPIREIRGGLLDVGVSVESLENSASVREAEAKVASLEEENSVLRAEIENLQGQLQTINTEIKRFREEEKKREEKKWDLPPIQFEILERLPSEHGGLGLTVVEMWREAGGRLDEMEIHFDILAENRLIESHLTGDDGKLWRRSKLGNRVVVARRLAGEPEQPKKMYNYPDLPQIQDDILTLLAATNGGLTEFQIAKEIDKNLAETRYYLKCVKDAEMASDSTKGDKLHPTWELLQAGWDYLEERYL